MAFLPSLPTVPSTRTLRNLLDARASRSLGAEAQKVSVFSRNRITTAKGTLQLDATLSESHTSEVETTEHPLETGASVADHLRPKPEAITLEAVISDDAPPDATSLPENVEQAVGDSPAVTLSVRRTHQPGRAKQAWQHLLEIKDSGELVTVATYLRDYTNMALVSLSSSRDAKTGSALRFTATFRRLTFVSLKTLRVAVEKAVPKQNLGKKTATPTEAPVANKSLAKQLVQAGSSILGVVP